MNVNTGLEVKKKNPTKEKSIQTPVKLIKIKVQ